MTDLGETYAPTTSSIGFLRASLDDASAALHQWRSRLHGSADAEPLSGGLSANVAALEPLTTGVAPRELLVATRNPEWTAIFDCGLPSGDPVSTVGHLSRTMACQGVVVAYIPDRMASGGLPERYGALQLEMFGPLPTEFLNYVRTISLVRDGVRWRFDATGTVQDFEDVDAYSRRKIAERFTRAMLVEYCAALGLEPLDDGFYPGPSVLVSLGITPPAGALALTRAEAQRWLGITPLGAE